MTKQEKEKKIEELNKQLEKACRDCKKYRLFLRGAEQRKMEIEEAIKKFQKHVDK